MQKTFFECSVCWRAYLGKTVTKVIVEFLLFNIMCSSFASLFDWPVIVTLYQDCVTGSYVIFVWGYQ